MRTGLQALAEAFGAEAAVLSRLTPREPSAAKSLCYDGGAGARVPIARSYAHCLLGQYVHSPRSGSIWYSSLIDCDAGTELRQLQRARCLADLVVIVLSVESKAIQFLELHFPHRLTNDSHGLMNALTGPLLSVWANRSPGRFSEALLTGSGNSAALAVSSASILSPANPAGLSRAEFRICTLLGSGLSAARVRDELRISQSTLRSHLRQIYAKTETSGIADLLYRLLASGTVADTRALALRHAS
ncbi:helix-turn-helix transcriptional regulator [Wenxinia marina]|nr:helix-turn-helix transcriptional regulator [Wenxinia marina]